MTTQTRVFHSDFDMGGIRPPIEGGGRGGAWRVGGLMCDSRQILRTLKTGQNLYNKVCIRYISRTKDEYKVL